MAVCCSGGGGGETSSKVPVLLKDHKVRGDVRRDPAHEVQQAHVRVCPLLANPKIMSCASCFRAFLRICFRLRPANKAVRATPPSVLSP